jgi:hypothetical protein
VVAANLLALHFVTASGLAAGRSSFAAATTEEVERRSARSDTEQGNSNTRTNDTALHGKLLKTETQGDGNGNNGNYVSPEPPAPRALEQCGWP